MQYWDVNEVTSDERATYRLGHTSDKNGYYRNLGYDYTSAQWKNGKNYARFLVLEYTRSHNGVSYAGYGRQVPSATATPSIWSAKSTVAARRRQTTTPCRPFWTR